MTIIRTKSERDDEQWTLTLTNGKLCIAYRLSSIMISCLISKCVWYLPIRLNNNNNRTNLITKFVSVPVLSVPGARYHYHHRDESFNFVAFAFSFTRGNPVWIDFITNQINACAFWFVVVTCTLVRLLAELFLISIKTKKYDFFFFLQILENIWMCSVFSVQKSINRSTFNHNPRARGAEKMKLQYIYAMLGYSTPHVPFKYQLFHWKYSTWNSKWFHKPKITYSILLRTDGA